MKRGFWIFFGLFTHAVFIVTVVRVFSFLGGRVWPGGGLFANWSHEANWFLVDSLLALQFGLIHSALLWPATRDRLERWVAGPHYGCFFCLATCTSLLLVTESWRRSASAFWRLNGAAGMSVSALYLLSWVALVYTLTLNGLGFQTGWSPWWAWVRNRALPARRFDPKGAYRLLRHPVYLSFLGTVWFNPTMTLDRLWLALVWTSYVYIGSCLKDRRLEFYLGDTYRQYQARVPGYPFIPAGPLAKVPFPK
jgi:hypothetical protein